MAPLAETVVFTCLALGAALLVWLLPPKQARAMVVGVLAAASAVAVLGLFPIHSLAGVVLSLGLGVRVFFWSRTRSTAITHRRGWRAVGVMVSAVVLLSGTQAMLSRSGDGRRDAGAPAADSTRPNVLLIVLDTEGANSLHLYGYPRATSDALDRIAGSSVTFQRAYSTTSWTLPAHGSLFTGRHSHELNTDFRTPLNGEYPTIAEVLSRRGYATGGFVANLRFTNSEFGLARGFARYDDYPIGPTEVLLHSSILRLLSRVNPVRQAVGYFDVIGRKRAPSITSDFLSWVDRHPNQPWFAFLNYWDAHEPYRPPRELRNAFGPTTDRAVRNLDYRTREVILWPMFRRGLPAPQQRAERDAYDASVVAVDRSIDTLIAQLRKRGLLDNTILVVTADHGEEHGERGHYTHAFTLNPNVLWVPLLIRFPPRVSERRSVDNPVSIRDVPATILELAGVTGSTGIAGTSLAGYWDGSRRSPTQPIASLFREDGSAEYSVTLDTVQYRIRDSVEWLGPLATIRGDPPNYAADPAWAAELARGRAVLDSVLRVAPSKHR